jgi:hypothetical protein
VSPDRRATLIPISLVEPGEDHIEDVIDVVQQSDGAAGFDVDITGEFARPRLRRGVGERPAERRVVFRSARRADSKDRGPTC